MRLMMGFGLKGFLIEDFKKGVNVVCVCTRMVFEMLGEEGVLGR